jgi:Tol biopolymer transport system component
VVGLSIGLAGCGGDDDVAAAPSATESPAPSTPGTTDTTSSPGTGSGEGAGNAETGDRIVFQRAEGGEDETSVYVVNADGSDEQLLAAGAGAGRWSPDGSEVSIFCCDDGMVAHIVDVGTGDVRGLEPPDPTLETNCGLAWSPDGERLACESFGVDDPSRNGIYTIRASDGGGLTRITSNPDGSDIAGDYSPDGTRLVFMRFEEDRPVGLFVTNVDGSGLRRLTPTDMILDDSGHAGSWSPSGDDILFVARSAEDRHKAIWIVNADSGSPEQLPITPVCGGQPDPGEFGCYSPGWSPDGEKVVFTRSDGSIESIHMVNADGSGLIQVTDGEDDNPDWGTP